MKVLIILANGSEEKEAMSIATVLARGGCEIKLVGVDAKDGFITGAHGVKIGVCCDISNNCLHDFDAVVLPGGMDGMQNSANNKDVLAILRNAHADKKLVAAMCASPIVLDRAGLVMDEFTCYPSLESEIKLSKNYTGKKAVISGNIITGKGPAFSDDFALCILGYLAGEDVRKKVEGQMLIGTCCK